MRIRYVRIQSYCGLSDVAFVVGENATLVGKNDAGKSSILQALGWFFWRGETGPPEDAYRWHTVDTDVDVLDEDVFPVPEVLGLVSQIAENIRVTVGFGDLTPADHQRLQQLLGPGSDAEYLHEVKKAEVGQSLLLFQRRYAGRVRSPGDPFNPDERASTLWLQAHWPRGVPPEIPSWHDEPAKGAAQVDATPTLVRGIAQQFDKLLQSINRYGYSEIGGAGPDPIESLLSRPFAGPFLRSLRNRQGEAGDTGFADSETGEIPSLRRLDEQPLTRGPWVRCDLSVLDLLPEFVHLVARVQDYRAWLSWAVTPLFRRTLRRELAGTGIPLWTLLTWLDVLHARFSYEARQALDSITRKFVHDGISLQVRPPGQLQPGVLGGVVEVDVPSSLGDGSQRRLLLSVLKLYENRELWTEDDALVLAIEEPELFLHPEAQRELVASIKGLRRHGIQSIVSTHSATMLDRADLDDVLIVRAAPGEQGDVHRSVSSLRFHSDQFREFLDELGHRLSDYLQAACVVLVEGLSDQKILEAWARTLLGHDLQGLGVAVVPSRGNAAMSFYVDAVLFREAGVGVRCVAVLDGDRGAAVTEQRIQKLRDAGLQDNRNLFVWDNCIESFLDRSALEQALQLEPSSISPTDFSRRPITNIEDALRRTGRPPIRQDERGRRVWYDKMQGAKAAKLMSRKQIHEYVEHVIEQIVHHAEGRAELAD